MIIRDYKIEIEESADQLKEQERKEKRGKVRDRLKFLRLLKEKKARTIREASELVGICAQTGYRIMSRYREGGIQSVTTLHYRGKPSKIGKDGEQLLINKANKTGFRTLKEAQKWLQEELGQEYTEPAVWFMLKRLKIKLKKGRTTTKARA